MASNICLKYVKTATEDPPSTSEDSNIEGYLWIISDFASLRVVKLTVAVEERVSENGRSGFVALQVNDNVQERLARKQGKKERSLIAT